MDIIFLDIDGVMISYQSLRLASLCFWRKNPTIFSRRALWALRRLVRRTGAQVVITSSWRGGGDDYAQFKSLLARNGTPVLDETPWLEDNTLDRSDEVFQWLQTHPAAHYVVLDDNDRFRNRLLVRAHWVPVDALKGLTGRELQAALRFFQ